MSAVGVDAGDAHLAAVARAAVGPDVPIGMSLDLHANVTQALVDSADLITGFRTHPHVDFAETGARAARLLMQTVAGELAPTTVLAKRPLLIPAETSTTLSGPMAELRALADDCEQGTVVDASLFPVQPWLDIDDLGFAAVVTANGDRAAAERVAERIADRAWELRDRFDVSLLSPQDAIAEARRRDTRPVMMSESGDSPNAGTPGDSPAMVRALMAHGEDLVAFTALRDPAAVAVCTDAGVGATVRLELGAGIERRWHEPVAFEGEVVALRDEPIKMDGPVFTGMELSSGRMAAIRRGKLSVIVTEIGPYVFAPAAFRALGLEPEDADVIVVRSACIFRAAFAEITNGDPIFLDIVGASTPQFKRLEWRRVPRPLYPLDEMATA
jgi:microcystin degradation protein MlrC